MHQSQTKYSQIACSSCCCPGQSKILNRLTFSHLVSKLAILTSSTTIPFCFLLLYLTSCPIQRCTMDSGSAEIVVDAGIFRLYKDGHADRPFGTDTVPAGFDADTGVTSKDVVIDAGNRVAARLYLPDCPDIQAASPDSNKKLPILVYFHGGAFIVASAGNPLYHRYLNSLVANARVVAVSVDYRLAPEYLLPAAYDDSWTALNWSVSGVDPWLSKYGDISRVFLAGDSAGGNIAHNMAIAAGLTGLHAAAPVRIEGALLLHPSFSSEQKMETEPAEYWECTKKRWTIIFPGARDGLDDPRMNPMAAGAPSLTKLACERMLVCTAAADLLAPRGLAYYEAVKASGWGGEAEWFESEGQQHVFFLNEPGSREAVALMDRVVAFVASH